MGNSALLKMITNRADWDIQREGRFTDPKDQSTSFDIEAIIQNSRENGVDVGTYIMEQLAFQPSSPINKEDDTLRFFVPGLNTPEPESSRRTQYYAEKLWATNGSSSQWNKSRFWFTHVGSNRLHRCYVCSTGIEGNQTHGFYGTGFGGRISLRRNQKKSISFALF